MNASDWAGIRAGQALWICQSYPMKWSSNAGFCRGQPPAKYYKVLAQRAKCRGSPGAAFGHARTKESSPWLLLGLARTPGLRSTPGYEGGMVQVTDPLQHSLYLQQGCRMHPDTSSARTIVSSLLRRTPLITCMHDPQIDPHWTGPELLLMRMINSPCTRMHSYVSVHEGTLGLQHSH